MVNIYLRKMDKKKHTLVFIHHESNMAGSAISLYQLIKSLDKDKYYPILILPAEGNAKEYFENLNIEVFITPFQAFYTFPGPRTFSMGFLKQVTGLLPNFKLRKLIKTLNPDIIHINDKAGVQAGISLLGLKYPIVQHIRSSYIITKSRIGRYLNNFLLKIYSTNIIIISEDEDDGFEDFTPKDIIYNSVDFERATEAFNNANQLRIEIGFTEDDFIIGYAAAQTKIKGYEDFLEIAAKLCLKNENIKLLILGEKNPNICPKYHPLLQNKITYTGYTKLNLEYIACMNLLLVPNLNKVLGRQPIEAQSLEVPVLAYRGRNNTQIIKNNFTGFLCDDKVDMYNYTLKLIESPKLYLQIKNNCIKHAKKSFDRKIMYKKIDLIYKTIIDNKK